MITLKDWFQNNLYSFLLFQYLRLQRDVSFSKDGVNDAENRINDIISVTISNRNVKKNKFNGDNDSDGNKIFNSINKVIDLAQKLVCNSEIEMNSIIKALNGEYIPAAPGNI